MRWFESSRPRNIFRPGLEPLEDARDPQVTLHALVGAIDAGDRSAVAAILRAEPALAGGFDPDGVSLLLRALYRNKAGVAEEILALAPPLSLFDAAALGRSEELRALLDREPGELESRSADGFTALHLAAVFDRPEIAAELLKRGADAESIAGNTMWVRPLHSAAAARAPRVVELLLQSGADPNARQAGGFTALHSAFQNDDRASIEALIAHGADVSAAADDGRRPHDFGMPSE